MPTQFGAVTREHWRGGVVFCLGARFWVGVRDLVLLWPWWWLAIRVAARHASGRYCHAGPLVAVISNIGVRQEGVTSDGHGRVMPCRFLIAPAASVLCPVVGCSGAASASDSGDPNGAPRHAELSVGPGTVQVRTGDCGSGRSGPRSPRSRAGGSRSSGTTDQNAPHGGERGDGVPS
jgi:hypothetical protein